MVVKEDTTVVITVLLLTGTTVTWATAPVATAREVRRALICILVGGRSSETVGKKSIGVCIEKRSERM